MCTCFLCIRVKATIYVVAILFIRLRASIYVTGFLCIRLFVCFLSDLWLLCFTFFVCFSQRANLKIHCYSADALHELL